VMNLQASGRYGCQAVAIGPQRSPSGNRTVAIGPQRSPLAGRRGVAGAGGGRFV